MISRKDTNKWIMITLANLSHIGKSQSTENILVSVDHGINIGNGKEFIAFDAMWVGGPRGSVRTEEDMDNAAKAVASALPVRCWFGKPDEVVKSKALPHKFEALVYLTNDKVRK